MNSLTAVLLAGGRSRRFGSDKAFAPAPGESTRRLWEHQLAKLESLQPKQVLISANRDQDFGDQPVMLDSTPDLGPLAGIAAALETAQTDFLVVLAIDMPQMSTEFLTELVSQATSTHGIVPRLNQRWEPLAAVYPTQLANLASERLRGNDRSLQGFVTEAEQTGQIQALEVDSETRADLFRNLNSPSQSADNKF